MNTAALPLQSLSARRPALRSAIAGAAFLLVSAAGTSALAQTTLAPQAELTAQSMPAPATSSAPTGRTRAEVIAELQCARASGELEASMLQSYGLAPNRTAPASAACGQPGGTALAGQPSRTTTP